MLRHGNIRYVSRHLYVVPKTEVITPTPLVLLSKKDCLKCLKRNPEAIPLELADVIPRFSGDMNPKELNFLVKRLRNLSVRPHNISEIKRSILNRTLEIGSNFVLQELVVVQRFFKGNRSISALLESHISRDSIVALSDAELISLVALNSHMSMLADELARRSSQMKVYELATIVNEVKKLNAPFTPSIRRLFERVGKHVVASSEIGPRDCSVLANAFAHYTGSSSYWCKDVFDHLSGQAITRLSEFSPQGTAILVHAFVKAAQFTQHAHLLTQAALYASKNIALFKSEGKAMGLLLYSLGKAELELGVSVLQTFAELIKRDIQSYDFQTIGCVCYGFSRLRFVADKDLWRIISDEVVYRGTEKRFSRSTKKVTPQDVAMIAKAFSHLKSSDQKLSYVLYQLLRNRLSDEQSAIVEVMDAFTRLEPHGQTVHAWVAKRLGPIVDKLSPLELVSAITSVGKLGLVNHMLYEKLITAANAKISDPKLRIVAAVRLAKLPKYDALFAKNTGKIISMNLSTLDLERLIDALFAFSEMNHRDEKLISRLVYAIKYQLDKGGASLIDPRKLSTLIVASSRLRMIDEQFYELLLTRIFEHISMFNSERALCNTLFAMASAVGSDDWKDETGWFVPVATELVGRLPEQLSVEGVRQIQIFSMTVKLKNIVFSDLSVVRKLDQVELVNTFTSNTPSIEQSSVPHREISKFLIQLGLEHRNEATIGPFSLDIFVPESRTVVEIDGPHHFFRDSTLRTSSSVLKHRILESFGYHVMHVPYHEWLQCNSDTKKLAYCTDLVAAIRLHAGTA